MSETVTVIITPVCAKRKVQKFFFLTDSQLYHNASYFIPKCRLWIISLIQKKSDTTQFLWVTIGPTGKLSMQYELFTYISICSF
jgi:hypothetical protein